MNKKYIFLTFGLIILVLLAYTSYLTNKKIGPDLLSIERSKEIALEKGELVTIKSVNLSTSGPVYRIVIGLDSDNREKAVWIGTEIVHSIYLDQGISKETLIQKMDKLGCTDPEYQLVYVSGPNKHKELSEDVYWFVSCKDKSSFIDFKTGKIVKEIK